MNLSRSKHSFLLRSTFVISRFSIAPVFGFLVWKVLDFFFISGYVGSCCIIVFQNEPNMTSSEMVASATSFAVFKASYF